MAETRIRKAIISNCNKELVNISEGLLNVLNGNICLSGCKTRKLQKHYSALRNVAEIYVSLSLCQEGNHSSARGISVASIKRCTTDNS